MSIAPLFRENGTTLTDELDQVFRQHHALVYRTAYGVTGSREDAQDIVQTLFLQLLRREVPPDLKKNPKAYLYRAAVNLSLTSIRQRKRRVFITTEGLTETASSDSDVLEELHARLYKAIA